MIKLVICDGNGTLDFPNPSKEIRGFVCYLEKSKIKLAVASNGKKKQIVERFRKAGLSLPSCIVTPEIIGKSKPSPGFIYKISDITGIKLNEMIFLGDDDNTDSLCAVNAGILPFVAKYSKDGKPRKYGLHINNPQEIVDYLRTYGRQSEPYFGWKCSHRLGNTNTRIAIYALIGQQRDLTEVLKSIFKNRKNVNVGPKKIPVARIFFNYLVSQCYQSNMIREIDLVTVYPGHEKGVSNQILGQYSNLIAMLFRDKYIPNLLQRHKVAPKSQFQGEGRNIFDQFRTVLVDREYREKIKDKSILVLDDFTTYGYSLETARRMLLKGGARNVIPIAIAKYRSQYSLTRISKSWDPFSPCTLKKSDIRVFDIKGEFNTHADDYFHGNIWKYYSGNWNENE